MLLLCWFDHFLDSRAEICQIFHWLFGKSMTLKRHSEIYWPLGFTHGQGDNQTRVSASSLCVAIVKEDWPRNGVQGRPHAFKSNNIGPPLIVITDYGRPMKAFFIKIPVLAFCRQFGRKKIRRPFWYCESLVHVFHYSTMISTKKLSKYR